MEIKFIIIPIISALIGWFTNFLAIKMIFRPYKPIIIPFIGLKLQGIIPKRRLEIARNLGVIIEEQLLSIKDLTPYIENNAKERSFINKLASIIKKDLLKRFPLFIPDKVKKILGQIIEDVLIKELPLALPNIIREGLDGLSNNIQIAKIIEDKINTFDIKKLESIIVEVTKRELKHIEYLGALLGFLIGLGQLLITKLFLI